MNLLSTNKNFELIKKVRRQDQYFSTRLPNANKKIREIWMKMNTIAFKTTEDKINELQILKGKTKLKFYKNLSNYHDEMNIRSFQFEEDPFSKNVQSCSKINHEVLLLKKFRQTEPQVKDKNKNDYDLYYTVIKNRADKEILNYKIENFENDYINYEDFIIPKHNISIKPRRTILK